MSVDTIIGLDLSLECTGISCWRAPIGFSPRWTMESIRTPSSMFAPERWRQVTARLWPMLTTNTVVVIERGIHIPKHGGTVTQALSEQRGAVRMGLHLRQTPEVFVDATKLKKFAAGKGSASKPQMITAAFDALDMHPANGDEADAVWLVAMALTHYGLESHAFAGLHSGMTPWRIEAMSDVEWPVWSPTVPPLERTRA